MNFSSDIHYSAPSLPLFFRSNPRPTDVEISSFSFRSRSRRSFQNPSALAVQDPTINPLISPVDVLRSLASCSGPADRGHRPYVRHALRPTTTVRFLPIHGPGTLSSRGDAHNTPVSRFTASRKVEPGNLVGICSGSFLTDSGHRDVTRCTASTSN